MKNLIVSMVHSIDASMSRSRMDYETWLEHHSEGWTNEEHLTCNAAESGEDREEDFDEEAYFKQAYFDEYLARPEKPLKA